MFNNLGFGGCWGHLWWRYDPGGCPHKTELCPQQGDMDTGQKAQGKHEILLPLYQGLSFQNKCNP